MDLTDFELVKSTFDKIGLKYTIENDYNGDILIQPVENYYSEFSFTKEGKFIKYFITE